MQLNNMKGMVNSQRPQLLRWLLLLSGWMLLFLGTSCQKEYDIFVPDDDQPIEEIVLVKNAIYGTVINQEGHPVQGASIFTKYGQTTTNEAGVFSFPDLFVRSDQGVIEVQHPDYFSAGRTFTAREGQLRTFEFILQSKDLSGTFEAGQGGEIYFPGGAYLQFPANAFQDVEGSAYNGLVLVNALILDPLEATLSKKLPASLWSSNQSVLKPYAFIQFELAGGNQEQIFLKENTGATLFLPIPAFLDVSESELDLWRYQSGAGTWEADGNLDVSGDYLIFQNAQTGAWLCAKELFPIMVQGRIADEVGTAYPNLDLEVRFADGQIFAGAQSLQDGTFHLKVPSEEALELNILNHCNEKIYSLPLGPLSEDNQLPTINLNQEEFFPIVLDPVLRNCAQEAILEGYYSVQMGEHQHTVFSNTGQWRTAIADCDAPLLVIQGFDFQAEQSSTPIDLDVQAAADLQEILICDGQDVFVNLTIDGEDYLGLQPIGYLEDGLTYIKDSTLSFQLMIQGQEPGSYPVEQEFFAVPGFPEGTTSDLGVNSTITYYGPANDVIIGSFGGTFQGPQGSSHTISGNYKVFRQF